MYPFTADTDFTGADADLPRVEKIVGFHVSCTTAALVNLRNGSVTGDIFVQIQVPAAASVHYSSSDARMLFRKGLFVDVVSGTGIQGSIQPG